MSQWVSQPGVSLPTTPFPLHTTLYYTNNRESVPLVPVV
ncbi:hypothetical protein TPMD04_1 [Thiohalocapsa phage LS06-2018-MD04]|nr:hypothetical protein TPMD04_1 [Thiohalocapsa phage LS06-2018-MD04]